LLGGTLSIGDELRVYPTEALARVRGLQTHGKKLERAAAGSRVAVNLSGISLDQVRRGFTLAPPDTLQPTQLLDVQIEPVRNDLFAHTATPHALLRHNSEIKFFIGATETAARLRLLQKHDESQARSFFAQLELSEPVVAAKGDRFIVRLPSPSVTLGGGEVLDANPVQRYRRRAGQVAPHVIERLEAALVGTPSERLSATLNAHGFVLRQELPTLTQMSAADTAAALDDLIHKNQAQHIGDTVARTSHWQSATEQLCAALTAYHKSQPLAEVMPRESLRSRLSLGAREFDALLRYAVNGARVVDTSDGVRLVSHSIQFTAAQQKTIDALMAQCKAQPLNTPSVKECRAQVGDAVFEALLRQKKIVQLNGEVVLLPDTLAHATQVVRDLILKNGKTTAAEVRDTLGTSRKYVLALLEHLDQTGVTKRVGDERVLRS